MKTQPIILMLRNIALVLLLQLLAFQTRAQTTHAFTAKQAADYAQQNAIAVKNALLDIKIQQQTNKEITAAALPHLSANGNFTDYLEIPTQLLPAEIVGGPAGTFIPVKFGTKYSAAGGIDLNQLLFDGQVFVGLQARKAVIQFATNQAEVTKEMIKANVYKVYYQLVVGKQQITTFDANISRFDKLLKDVTEIYKNGFAERLDIDKVQVQLNNLKTAKLKLENQLQVGNAGLKFLMNMPQKDSLILTDSLTEDELKANLLEEQYNYSDRKEFQLLSSSLKLNEYNIRRYKLSRIPTLSAFGSYQKNAQRSKFDFFKGGDWFTTSLVGLRLNVPIFDGFERKSKIESAKLDLQKTRNKLDELKENIDYDVSASRLNMKTALQTIDNQKQNVALAEKVYNSTKLKFEQGLGDNQEIYTAQTELKVAQNDYYSALYDAIVAKIDYLKATGKLP
jgi:outer membrane protein